MRAALVLEDGGVFQGVSFGAEGEAFGEVVFNTGMVGYQESLTDPSYAGQILVMAYPLIGNYGILPDVGESARIQVSGFVVREAATFPSHRASQGDIASFLAHEGVVGLQGIDTRALIRRLRVWGTMKGAIVPTELAQARLPEIRERPHPCSTNLVAGVSTPEPKRYPRPGSPRVVVIDCGIKQNILRELQKRFEVVQLPYDATREAIWSAEPDGLLISNGPGDPAHPSLDGTTSVLREVAEERLPTLGICLGLQLLARAFGLETYKLKFGHRGANQPVLDGRGRAFITSQNHGYAVRGEEAERVGLEVTQISANDGTVEGLQHRDLPIEAVQYHPEAAPGPHDTRFVIDRFAQRVVGRGGGG